MKMVTGLPRYNPQEFSHDLCEQGQPMGFGVGPDAGDPAARLAVQRGGAVRRHRSCT